MLGKKSRQSYPSSFLLLYYKSIGLEPETGQEGQESLSGEGMGLQELVRPKEGF